MALIGNYSILNRQLSKQFGGTVASGFPAHITPTGFYKNRFGAFDNNAATPNGYLHPAAWVLPMKSGGMSSYNQTQFSITQSNAILVNAQYRTASGTIVFTQTSADLGQIFAGVASGSISLSAASASLSAIFEGVASGAISFAVADATLGGTFSMTASGTVVFTPSGLLTAKAFMEASAGGATPLSPEGLAAAVWSAAASAYNDAGTMGEKLNDAGSASNPWTEVIESGYTAGEILRLLAAVSFGKSNIIDLGGGSATVQFRDIADTKDRIEASMVGSERTSITIDETP
jgi:hypothetical protein